MDGRSKSPRQQLLEKDFFLTVVSTRLLQELSPQPYGSLIICSQIHLYSSLLSLKTKAKLTQHLPLFVHVAWVHAVCTCVCMCACHGVHVKDRGQPWVLVLPFPLLERQQRQQGQCLLLTAAHARLAEWRTSGSPGPNLIFQKDHRECRWVCYCAWLWSLKILKKSQVFA